MRKLILFTNLFFLTLVMGFSAHATNVGGAIMDDTVWTKADSPIVVTSNVTVIEGVTLTIEPGVEVRFNQGMALFIDGTLNARGTSDEKISFTSNGTQEKGYWGFIFFSDTSTDATFDGDGNYTGGCILQYAIVQYGGSGRQAIATNISSPFIDNCVVADNNNGGISVLKSSLIISNCKIEGNFADNDFGGGICANSSTVTIKDSIIDENTAGYGGGIFVNGSTVVTIQNSTISGNDADYGGGICARYGDSTITIQNSTISGNNASYGGGIDCYYDNHTIIIKDSTISGNSAYDGGGIYESSRSRATITIQNCTIRENSANSEGSGICINGSPVTIIKGNRIIQNTTSENFGGVVYLKDLGNDSVIGGTAEDANVIKDNTGDGVYIGGYPVFNYNDVYNNTGFELINGSSGPIDASNCYWGTTDEFAIKAEIYDGHDDAMLEIVNYKPFLTEPNVLDDVTPPATVTDLATSNPTANSITLAWTAPGDDGNEGQAKTYDIRFSTSEITESGWNEATQCTGVPAPKPAGESETFAVTGLSPNTTYYFALKTADEMQNWSELSNVATGTTFSESIPPAAVIDFAIFTLTGNSVILKWTAPGDDGDVGTAAQYDIRYSTSEITDANWNTATQCTDEPAPQEAGSEEIFTVKDMLPFTIYYFALKTADEVPNWSALSNVVACKTPAKTGDVSGDGDVSAYDASLILQYVVGLIDELPCDSLAASQRAVPANYMLTIPDVTAKNGNPIIVPITVNNAEKLIAGGLSVIYDQSLLRVVEVTPKPLLNGAYWKSNVIEETGEIRFAFAMFDQEQNANSSSIMQIQFESLGDVEGITTDLIIEKAEIAKGLSIKTIDGSIIFLPGHSALLQNYPNPFNPDTWIPFKLASPADVVISIYDIRGQLMRKIGLAEMPAGMYVNKDKAVYWDGRNSSGEKVSSGLYFYQLQAGDYRATKRMLILK